MRHGSSRGLQSRLVRGLLAPVSKLIVLLALAALGCNQSPESSALVELKMGKSAAQPINFEATTSLAQYMEIPGSGNELRVTLASYRIGCDVFTPPGEGEASVSVVITTPPGVTPASGVYPWLGHDSHGGQARAPAKAYSYPTARLGPKSYLFPPGGGVVLKELNLDKHGSVSGLLNYEFAGNAKQPATSLKGRFTARICQYDVPETP